MKVDEMPSWMQVTIDREGIVLRSSDIVVQADPDSISPHRMEVLLAAIRWVTEPGDPTDPIEAVDMVNLPDLLGEQPGGLEESIRVAAIHDDWSRFDKQDAYWVWRLVQRLRRARQRNVRLIRIG